MDVKVWRPMPLTRIREPFSHPDWIFELKYDGFRAVAYLHRGTTTLVSRNGGVYRRFTVLQETLTEKIPASSAVLDGEIVCLGEDGRTEFNQLLFRCGEPRFVAFDLLWLNGRDLRYLPLLERKRRLHSLIPTNTPRLLYADCVERDGEALFEAVCGSDLEGVVAKRSDGVYIPDQSDWLKIKNPDYSQSQGRWELFQPALRISYSFIS